MLAHFKQDEEIRLSNSNNDPLPVPHIINLTASCVNVSLEGVEAFDRTVAQVTRHVSSLFLSEHTALFRLHLIMSETESAREGYYWNCAHVVWCLPKMEKLHVEVLSTFFTVTNHSILFLLDRHQTACSPVSIWKMQIYLIRLIIVKLSAINCI